MILDQQPQLDQFKGRTVFLYPIFRDANCHAREVDIIGYVILDVNTREVYVLSVSHPEGVYSYTGSLEFLASSIVYSYDTQALQYKGIDTTYFIDCQAQYYLYSNQACNFETPSIINHYARAFPNCNVIGSLISLSKHVEIAQELLKSVFVKEIQPGLSFYQTTLLPALHTIEQAGLKVDPQLFTTRFGSTPALVGDYALTQYNPYTITGRPSNRFGGVNFAALSKEDGTRQAFISRFGDQGSLVEVDFNAYHPRLIASLVGYDFKSEGAYQHLAAQYYKGSPSEEQITAMKEATFRQIYGGVQNQYLSIPFFYAADELAKALWDSFDKHGFVESLLSQRKIRKEHHPDMTRSLLFNYFIQMHETESNAMILKEIHYRLVGMQTKPILYTYDSILFDTPKQEVEYLLNDVLPDCVDIIKFPIKTKVGSDYGSLAVY